MHKLLIAGLLWLAVVFPTRAKSVVYTVTPKELDGGGEFVFAVTNSPDSRGLMFHVAITPKKGEVPADSEVQLCSVRMTKNSGSIGPLTPQPRIALKRNQHAWNAVFVASNESLSTSGVCFVFTVWDHKGPAADFYVLKLRDFLNDVGS